MRSITVKVQPDHLERMTKVRKPLLALAELVWNALDADARDVFVDFERTPLDGIRGITVADDGHGIKYEDALSAFENLGGSSKQRLPRSRKEGRLLHGKLGKGRFRAFALGNAVTWETRFESSDQILKYRIHGNLRDLSTFDVDDPSLSDEETTGTRVIVSDVITNLSSLASDQALQDITAHFALYLRQYPDITIYYDGSAIDPALVERYVTDYPLEPIQLDDGRPVEAELTIIEWTHPAERSLYLCDASGFALGETTAGIQAPGFNFTAYLKSQLIRDLDDGNALPFDSLHPDLKKLIDPAKATIREHFRRRAAELAIDLVEEWKRDEIYPYSGEARSTLETAERQVFDICAVNVASFLPDFDNADKKTRKFSFQLLRQSLEESPESLLKILEDVVGLPKAKQEELAALLEKTSLAAIISAAKVVADRLDFLRGLEILVFDPDSKKRLLERKELQRILVDHTWIFGEEFNLSVDDQSLTEVLRKHLELLGEDRLVEEPVVREDGTVGIVDLMLSRLIPQPREDEREHLVAELKRPSKIVDQKEAAQIKSYAFSVANDERFKDTKTKWVFWLISNEITDSVRRDAKQRNRPVGLLYDDPEEPITIWVKTWAQIINQCRARLTFFQKQLHYEADRSSALEYLRRAHEKYLPSVLLGDLSAEYQDAPQSAGETSATSGDEAPPTQLVMEALEERVTAGECGPAPNPTQDGAQELRSADRS